MWAFSLRRENVFSLNRARTHRRANSTITSARLGLVNTTGSDKIAAIIAALLKNVGSTMYAKATTNNHFNAV